MNGRVGAVIVAAGASTRMGFDKVWADLGDRPVLSWSVQSLGAVEEIEHIVVVLSTARYADAGPGKLNADLAQLRVRLRTTTGFGVGFGGSRRRDSVAAGLKELESQEWVVVHDGARPFLPPDTVRRGLVAARATGAAVAGTPSRDTVKRVSDGDVVETLSRAELWSIQTPQVFRCELLRRALESSDQDVTDEATLVERMGGRVRVFAGSPSNLKITTPEDLELARAMLAAGLDGTAR